MGWGMGAQRVNPEPLAKPLNWNPTAPKSTPGAKDVVIAPPLPRSWFGEKGGETRRWMNVDLFLNKRDMYRAC